MLSKPVLARCDNRAQMARINPVYGEPDQWTTSTNLVSEGLSAISFDFFIDWSANPLVAGNELWIKRITRLDVDQLTSAHVLQGALDCGDDLGALGAFAARYGFNSRYMIFRDRVDWVNAPEQLLAATLVNDGFTLGVHSLAQIKNAIRKYSGGPVRIGGKGLMYGTSSLECHLSRTDALWPGDADCVLSSTKSSEAVALLEFKKHNLETPLADENIQKYMRQDARKWQRLGLLRDRIAAPLFCVYYSTNRNVEHIKVERLVGPFDALQDGGSKMVSIEGMSQAGIGLAIAQAVTR